jgi:glutaredoxin
VTPSCPYCPVAVRRAHQIALAADGVRADMIEVSDFPELAARRGVHDVPTTLIDGEFAFSGPPEEQEYVLELLRRGGGGERGERRPAVDG